MGCWVRDVCGGDGGLERWVDGYQPRAVHLLRQECKYHAGGELRELQLWRYEWERREYRVWWRRWGDGRRWQRYVFTFLIFSVHLQTPTNPSPPRPVLTLHNLPTYRAPLPKPLLNHPSPPYTGTTPSSPTSPTGGPSAADQNETVTLADPDCTTTDTGFIPAGTEAAAAYASASAYASAYACAGSDCSTNSDSSSDTTATAGASASASAYATDAASAGGAVASESGSGTIGPVASYTPTPGSASQLGGERLMKTSGVLGVVALGFAFFI